MNPPASLEEQWTMIRDVASANLHQAELSLGAALLALKALGWSGELVAGVRATANYLRELREKVGRSNG